MRVLRRIDLSRSEEVLAKVERYKEAIVRRLKPKKIILFGSFARGDYSEASDIDLIVVADWSEPFLDRIKVLLELNDQMLPVEPIGYTEEELRRMIENGNPFILKALEEGVVIYEESHPTENEYAG
ncbi:MAG: nucleotidyltransferase domain-containing protein [Nanopusillaceae archaeon]